MDQGFLIRDGSFSYLDRNSFLCASISSSSSELILSLSYVVGSLVKKPILSELAFDSSMVLSLPLPFPPVVESLVALFLDAVTSSLIVIPFPLCRGGVLLPALLGLVILAKDF